MYFYVQDTREENGLTVVVDSYLRLYRFSPDVWHQKLLEIVHRGELKVNWILSAKVEFLNSEKGPRDRYKLSGYTVFHNFQKGRQKRAREARDLVSNLESRW